jgi:hypothetical protein
MPRHVDCGWRSQFAANFDGTSLGLVFLGLQVIPMRHSFGRLAILPSLAAIVFGAALPDVGRGANPVADAGDVVESKPAIATAVGELPLDPARWIQQLESAEFSERQEASRKLAEAGRGAFEALESAATEGSREVVSRAIEILRRHHEGGEGATRAAATAALSRLKESGHASAAKQASEALDPPKEPEGIALNAALPAVRPAIRLQIGAIQRAGLPAGNLRRTHVKTINGKREIEVQDGDKITNVKELDGDALEAEITEKVNGKETTRKIAAKNLDDLKKQDEAAAKIYEQHARRAAGAARAGPIPAQLGKQQLEQIDKMIEQMKQQQAGNPALPRLLESLERHREQIKQRIPAEGQQEAAPAIPAEEPAKAARAAEEAKVEAVQREAEAAAAEALRALQQATEATEEAAKAAAEAQP